MTATEQQLTVFAEEDLPAPLVEAGIRSHVDSLMLAQLQNTAGITIDDDNEPIAENIPTESHEGNITMAELWGHSAICNWQQAGGIKS